MKINGMVMIAIGILTGNAIAQTTPHSTPDLTQQISTLKAQIAYVNNAIEKEQEKLTVAQAAYSNKKKKMDVYVQEYNCDLIALYKLYNKCPEQAFCPSVFENNNGSPCTSFIEACFNEYTSTHSCSNLSQLLTIIKDVETEELDLKKQYAQQTELYTKADKQLATANQQQDAVDTAQIQAQKQIAQARTQIAQAQTAISTLSSQLKTAQQAVHQAQQKVSETAEEDQYLEELSGAASGIMDTTSGNSAGITDEIGQADAQDIDNQAWIDQTQTWINATQTWNEKTLAEINAKKKLVKELNAWITNTHNWIATQKAWMAKTQKWADTTETTLKTLKEEEAQETSEYTHAQQTGQRLEEEWVSHAKEWMVNAQQWVENTQQWLKNQESWNDSTHKWIDAMQAKVTAATTYLQHLEKQASQDNESDS